MAISLTACGQGVDPHTVLVQSASAVSRLRSVTGDLTFSAGTVSFQGFSLVAAHAQVRLPDDSQTTYDVRSGDTAVSVQVIITGGSTYLKIFFGGFQKLSAPDAASIPDLAKLFDSAHGLPALIPAGTGATFIADESIDNVNCHKVSATYTKEQIATLLPPLSSSGAVKVTIWSGVDDHLIRKAVLQGPFGDGGAQANVTVHLTDFNGPVTIAAPTG